MFKKFSFSTWLGIAIVAVLVAVNVPRVFSDVFLCTDGTRPDHLGLCYGNEITMGFYGYYGYGSSIGYWNTLGNPNPHGFMYGNIAPGTNGKITVGPGEQVTATAGNGNTFVLDSTSTVAVGTPTGPKTIGGTSFANSITMGEATFEVGGVSLYFPPGTVIASQSPLSPWNIDDTLDVSTISFTNDTGFTLETTVIGFNLGQCVTFDPPMVLTLNAEYANIVYIRQNGPLAGTAVSLSSCENNSVPSYAEACTEIPSGGTTTIRVRTACSVYAPAAGSTGGTTTGGGGGGGGIAPVATTTTTTETVTTTTETVVTTPSGKTFTVPAGIRVRSQLFPDVPRGAWYYGYVEALRKGGIVHGTQAGNFEPARDLTRAELVKIALNTFAIDIPASVSARPFNDVGTQHWATPYIQRAKSLGIISGYADGTFRPDQSVNRVEALKILLLASGLSIEEGDMNFPDTVKGSWYERYVAFAQSLGIVGGYPDGTFQPGNNIKRSEMAKIAVETLEEVL